MPRQIVFQHGKLTARLIATPLRQVMEELSKVSGARVWWLGDAVEERLVSAEFTALPLPEALRRILGETNFLLFYASGGEGSTLTQIWISSKKTSGGQQGFTSGLGAHAPRPPDSDSSAENAKERQVELDAIPIETLIQTAVSTLSPSVRVEAIARLGEYAPADPKVEDILSHLALRDSNAHVQAAASEVLRGIASRSE